MINNRVHLRAIDESRDLPDQAALGIYLFDREHFSGDDVCRWSFVLNSHGLDVVDQIDVDLSGPALNIFPASWDPPFFLATAVLAFDAHPERERKSEGFDNRRFARGVLWLRRELERAMPAVDPKRSVAALDGAAAWRLIELVFPGEAARVHREAIDAIERIPPATVIADLTSHGDRSRVELIEWGDGLAVRKIYRRTALARMEREIHVLETFGPRCPVLAQLLDKGPNYIVTEYIADGKPPVWDRPLRLGQVRKLAGFVRHCIANGFDPIDNSPGVNTLWVGDGFRVIDCEFWRACDPALPPERSICMAGVAEGDRDAPRASWTRNPYTKGWIDYTCLDLHSFFYDPAWLQRLKRPFVYLRLALANAIARIRRRICLGLRWGR